METWFWILGWSLSILTITGNGFIIFLVCSKRQLRTKTNAFVVSLAVADLCVGMSAVPSLFACEMANWCNPQAYLTDGVDFIRWLFGYASVTNLCSLVLDRYIAVVKPLKYLTFMKRRRIIEIISLSWAIPVAFVALLSLIWLIFKITLVFQVLIWLLMIFFEFLPCCILIFCFSSMLCVVCKHDRAARTLAKQLRFNHRVLSKNQETSAVKTMAIVIGLFLLCYGCFMRCSYVLLFNDDKPCNDHEYKIPLVVLNSAINP
ncbi:hypothetical protein OS493_017137 [Desmophyllum pertusum]|uniref:G-protein coupled receptors family 1 profile domain-containing protein n=1 Tax=Desmophyllum pertusum TaxID=174260 RepID=A0A9X0CED8_9CNID|nr:hypothetical protein OS493_017137 [Desmophyllum pertusum]